MNTPHNAAIIRRFFIVFLLLDESYWPVEFCSVRKGLRFVKIWVIVVVNVRRPCTGMRVARNSGSSSFVGKINNSSWLLRRDLMLRRKLVDVPATSQRLYQLHTARHLLHAE